MNKIIFSWPNLHSSCKTLPSDFVLSVHPRRVQLSQFWQCIFERGLLTIGYWIWQDGIWANLNNERGFLQSSNQINRWETPSFDLKWISFIVERVNKFLLLNRKKGVVSVVALDIDTRLVEKLQHVCLALELLCTCKWLVKHNKSFFCKIATISSIVI